MKKTKLTFIKLSIGPMKPHGLRVLVLSMTQRLSLVDFCLLGSGSMTISTNHRLITSSSCQVVVEIQRLWFLNLKIMDQRFYIIVSFMSRRILFVDSTPSWDGEIMRHKVRLWKLIRVMKTFHGNHKLYWILCFE